MTVEGCGSESLQGDVRFGEVMALMGAHVQWQPFSITITGELPALTRIGGTMHAEGFPCQLLNNYWSCWIMTKAASGPCAASAQRVTDDSRGIRELCVLLLQGAWLLSPWQGWPALYIGHGSPHG